MRLLDRYIFIEWLKAFLLSVLTLWVILLLGEFQYEGMDLVEWGATAPVLIEYYWTISPTFLPLIIPICLLVSILFTLCNLHRNNEIISMRSAGITLFRISRPLWFVGVALSLALLYLNASVVPHAMEVGEDMRDELRNSYLLQSASGKDLEVIPLLAFDNQTEGRLWLMNRFSDYTDEGYGVTLYQYQPDGKEVMRIMGREAFYNTTAGFWVFVDGRELRFDPQTGDAIYSQVFEHRDYPELTENPELMQLLNKRTKDLSFFELEEILRRVPVENNPRMTEYHMNLQSILADPFGCLVMVGIAIPFAVAGVRTNPMVGVSKSFGLFFFFFGVQQFLRILGAQQVIPTVVAAWTPIGIMLLVAVYLFWKMR